jgi:DNA-binding response OmpR family regulator
MGTVLVVDDIAGNARLLESLLAPDGHAVRTAGDGAEALRLVRAEPPDLVLMDVMMPHVDGFEACQAIKQDPSTRLIPVVLITSLDDTVSRIRGIDAGADDFVSKPFNAPELRARVRSLLCIKRYTDELDSAESVIVSLALTIESHDRRPLPASRAVRLRAGPDARARRGGGLCCAWGWSTCSRNVATDTECRRPCGTGKADLDSRRGRRAGRPGAGSSLSGR